MHAQQREQASLKIVFGVKSSKAIQYEVGFVCSPAMNIGTVTGSGLEQDDVAGTVSMLHFSGEDQDVLTVDVQWPQPVAPLRKLASHKDGYAVNNDAMWGYLMQHGSKGQPQRLKDDPWAMPDASLLTVQLNKSATKGFTIGLQQLLKAGFMWLPQHDIYVSLTGHDLPGNLANLTTGSTTLQTVLGGPEATLQEFITKWEDIGNPLQWKASWQTKYMGTQGLLTVLAPRHGSIYKCAIDRWGNVRPDFASPHRFSVNFSWEGSQWQGQHLLNGWPVLQTKLKNGATTAELEQCMPSRKDKAGYREGAGLILSTVRFKGNVNSSMFHISLEDIARSGFVIEQEKSNWILYDSARHKTLCRLQVQGKLKVVANVSDSSGKSYVHISIRRIDAQPASITVVLASPAIDSSLPASMGQVNEVTARREVIRYWQQWENKGALFQVPEKNVNTLWRANLWHALALPRHEPLPDSVAHMDLPYANTAYGQRDADWPINQAVYVDYLLYGLRGYDSTAQQEYKAMFASQQQPDGRIGGFANWGVYSPGQLFAIANHYLLNHNDSLFKELLPASLKALDWCLLQVRGTGNKPVELVAGPLNDLTKRPGMWAFTQAYYVAGLASFAKALAQYGHPRAAEIKQVADELRAAVLEAFEKGSVKAPVVQWADGSWGNFVPTDAAVPRRMMEEWYPTDVDCGPLHLSRLGVIEPFHWMTTAMLNDHEDNLFYKNLGAANEPVYVQQANTYLQRDEVPAIIRSFYSLMACGFAHEQFTSLEHRWAWGQYYGPPSTDGAWFEIYRNMLLSERGDDTLFICQAIPRPWLQKGKQVLVKDAPSRFGKISVKVDGVNVAGEIKANVKLSDSRRPQELIIRLRHPEGKQIKTVSVNGVAWKAYDNNKEIIKISQPAVNNYEVIASY
ncbi:hypothetical protein [Foetidibacter luteolus]|uniref:hypothetical protein n=1 Tax=Foetidibacter luteolus TaxID=2608880 RepID=UPI00129A7182|nr:hypothetical protein [Foetidibacter luteolus]